MEKSADEQDHEYDVCLSFAGEDRDYVRRVASELKRKGVRVFYDEYEEVDLWGKDLYVHLDDIYKNAARYCVLFVSQHYAKKLWTNHERRSAQERALKENTEYILPARFDDTPAPGLRDTVGYIDLRGREPEDFAGIIRGKIGGHFRRNYLPPLPDGLFCELQANTEEEKEEIYGTAATLLSSLKRMTAEERDLLFRFFLNACPAELPENVHINIDLLRRTSGFTPSKIKRLLAGLQSLGFFTKLREDDETEGHLGRYEMVVLEWHDMSITGRGNATDVANAMIVGAASGYCEQHALEALTRLDFSQLAAVTSVADDHPPADLANKVFKSP
jgi:hypothetical protein